MREEKELRYREALRHLTECSLENISIMVQKKRPTRRELIRHIWMAQRGLNALTPATEDPSFRLIGRHRELTFQYGGSVWNYAERLRKEFHPDIPIDLRNT